MPAARLGAALDCQAGAVTPPSAAEVRQRAHPSGLAHLQTHRPARQSPVTEGGVRARGQHQPCMAQLGKMTAQTESHLKPSHICYAAFAHMFLSAHYTAPELSAHPQPLRSARGIRMPSSRATRMYRAAPSALAAGTSHAAHSHKGPRAHTDTQQTLQTAHAHAVRAFARLLQRSAASRARWGAKRATTAGRSAGACGHSGEHACLTSANSLASPAAPLPRALQRRSAPAAARLMVEHTRACHLPLGVAGSLQAQTVRRVQRRGAGCCCRRRLARCRGKVSA